MFVITESYCLWWDTAKIIKENKVKWQWYYVIYMNNTIGVCSGLAPNQSEADTVNWELCCLQYMLSEQTIDALKKPAFDVWLWEANEVRLSSLQTCFTYNSNFLSSLCLCGCPMCVCVCLCECSTICLKKP